MTQDREHKLVIRDDVLDAVNKAVSQQIDATVKRRRRLQSDPRATDRDKEQSKVTHDLLLEAQAQIAKAQADSLD